VCHGDRIPRPRWPALYAALAVPLLGLFAAETLPADHRWLLEIACGLGVVVALGSWVHANRIALDLDDLAVAGPEEYTGGMARAKSPRRWRGYLEAAVVVAACTGVAQVMFGHVDESSLAMLYLAGVVLIAARGSRGAALFACFGSVAAFDFFFVPPYFTLEVAEAKFFVTFAMMLVVALVISGLTRRVRAQAERARALADEAQAAWRRAETERVRSALLSSVSHDLRTPLAAITGAASTMLQSDGRLDVATRRELLESIHEEADRLNRLVHNLVDATRLESGALHLRREWFPLEELVGGALARLTTALGDRPVTTRLALDLPPVPVDGLLVEQALINLVDNAAKHTPPGEPIEIGAWRDDGAVTVEVADRGPGLAPGEERRVFDKFYRRRGVGGGIGLGLTVCRGIVESHGGRVWAENRPDGGARFRFTLPLGGVPPRVDVADG
jgi:two-component system, OmpR family, sensor histidine kinase KdpD